MRKVLITLLVTSALFSQTVVREPRIQPNPVTADSLWGIDSTTGRLVPVKLGAGLTFDKTAGQQWTLNSSAAAIQFVTETPTGTIDGTNSSFALSRTPAPGSLDVFKGGLYQTLGFDYTLATNIITFINNSQPIAGEKLICKFR